MLCNTTVLYELINFGNAIKRYSVVFLSEKNFQQKLIHKLFVYSTVTSAVFANKADHVVSGSDDRTVKVYI